MVKWWNGEPASPLAPAWARGSWWMWGNAPWTCCRWRPSAEPPSSQWTKGFVSFKQIEVKIWIYHPLKFGFSFEYCLDRFKFKVSKLKFVLVPSRPQGRRCRSSGTCCPGCPWRTSRCRPTWSWRGWSWNNMSVNTWKGLGQLFACFFFKNLNSMFLFQYLNKVACFVQCSAIHVQL